MRQEKEDIAGTNFMGSMEAVFLSVPRPPPPPPPPIIFSFDLGSAFSFSSVCCIPYLTKRKRKTHQEKPPATQAKAKAHGRTFSRRIEHVGFSKLTQANLTEAEVERFMSLSAQL